MTSADGSRSLQGASNELYDITCGPCQTDNVDKQANHYCNECREYLCNVCKDAHRKLAITKNHNILSGKKIPAPTAGSQKYGVPIYCGCNKNQTVEFYCEEHHDVICNLCKKLKHRNCEINDVQYKVTNYSTKMPSTVLTKRKSLKQRYDSMLKQRKSDLKQLNGQIEECRKEIKEFRATIDSFVDKLEVNAVQELDKFDTKQKQHIGQHISTLTTGLQMLESDNQQLEDAKHTTNKVKMFTTEVQLSKSLQEYETLIAEMENDVYIPTLSFVGNKQLTKLETEITSLGNLKGIDKSLPHISKGRSQCTKKTLLSKKASLQSKATVRSSADKKVPWISSCTFMPSGHAVFCDRGNEYVKLLDKNLVVREHLKPCSWPWNVSVIDDNNVIITLPVTKQLQYIQVFPQLKTGRTIQLEKECYGIEVFGNEIYTTQMDDSDQRGEVLILDLSGRRKRKLQTNVKFYDAHYITVSSSGKKIFVSAGLDDTAAVTCLTTDGNLVYQYKDKELRCPWGMYVDAEDNILVCDESSNTVQVITANGKKYGNLLSSSDGINNPCSIAYRETDDTLLLGCCDDDHVFIYKML